MLAALQRAGVAVPGEVSVAGYDDTLSRLSCFDQTTVVRAPVKQARYAVAAAVERLGQDRAEPREVVLTPELVVRGPSAGSARADRGLGVPSTGWRRARLSPGSVRT